MFTSSRCARKFPSLAPFCLLFDCRNVGWGTIDDESIYFYNLAKRLHHVHHADSSSRLSFSCKAWCVAHLEARKRANIAVDDSSYNRAAINQSRDWVLSSLNLHFSLNQYQRDGFSEHTKSLSACLLTTVGGHADFRSSSWMKSFFADREVSRTPKGICHRRGEGKGFEC